MKKLLLLSFLLSSIFSIKVEAQVYETPALKEQEEQHILEKNKRLGIVPTQKFEEEKPVQKALDAKLLVNTYKLTAIEAVDYSKKHSEAEMKAFQQEMKEEFFINDIQIANDFSIFYVIYRKDNSKYLAKQIKKENDKLVYLDCEKCNMDDLIIIVNSNNELILETRAQDSDSFYTVRFTLKK